MPRWLRFTLIALTYWGSHLLGYLFLSPIERISPIWPASGVGLAFLLLGRKDERWATLGLLAGVTFASNLALCGSWGLSFGFTVANTAELALAGLVLTAAAQGPITFGRVRDVLALALVATLGTVLPAMIGAFTATLATGAPCTKTFGTWWISDGLGILLFAPLLVSFTRPEPTSRPIRSIEALGLALAWAGGAWVAFRAAIPLGPLTLQPYMLLPLLVWTALRLGTRGVTLALVTLAAVGIASTFWHTSTLTWGQLATVDRLLTTQVYVAVAAVTSLLLAASTTELKLYERARAEDQARCLAAEERSRSNAEWLHLALDAAGMGTWEWDVATNRVRWSDGVERLFGMEPGAFAGNYQQYLDLVHPADLREVERAIAGAVKGETSDYRIQHRVTWPDGSLHWVEGKGSVHRDATGKAVRMTGTVVEVTARKQAEAELLASEEVLRTFIQHTPAAVAMFDTEMRYLQAAERWLSDYRLDGSSLIGRSHYEVFPDIPERWKEVHRRALAGAVEECEEDPFVREDGTTEWLRWEVHPWRKAGGQIGGVIMFTQVITERKHAADLLRQHEARFRRLIEHASDMITVINREGLIRFQSPSSERLLGRKPEELVGRNALEFTHEEDLPAALAALAEADHPDDQPTTVKIRFRHRDGSYRLLELVGRSVPEEAPDGYIVINARDITESTALQEKLRQTQKLEALGTLAGGIAHDFNNILGAMLAFTELARLENPDNPTLGEYLHEVTSAGKRATFLVRQILSFSRQQPTERRPLALTNVVSEVLALLRSTLPATIDIVTNLPRSVPHVLADSTQMHQVVMNVCTNAAQAMHGRGRLSISLEVVELARSGSSQHAKLDPGTYVCLSIEDTGHGMSAATLDRVFEPFFTTKGPGAGTGLGLAVAHGIVNDHGGAIAVHSTQGLGTTVVIHLPIVQAKTVVPERRASEPPPGAGERILFVDDEQALCAAAATILARAGYEPVVCRDAVDAWSRLEADPTSFALVVSDLTMPGMTGVELAARIRGIRADLPIVLTSGHAGGITPQHLRDLGVAELLEKPVDYRQLMRTVARLVRKSPLTRHTGPPPAQVAI